MNRLTQTAIAFAAAAMISQLVMAQSLSLSRYDQLKVTVQKICPVTGEPLGSKGDPLKVRIGEEEIFLCSKSCAKGQINKEHWIAIHRNFAEAQGICPVMEKALPENPKSTVVNGQTVYICCPPCIKKIQADPKTFLTKVAGYYQESLRSPNDRPSASNRTVDARAADKRFTERDQLRIAVQRICPVSGMPLGSMGSPIKVRAGEVDLFLCCEGCKQGKVSTEHWKTIRGNIAKAQAICPVMENELPANAKSTVIDGQLVFVCCPPCTKKIAGEPERFLSKVDSYYRTATNVASSRKLR